MSSQTTNLHLVKPSDNERADNDVINANMDTIDAAVGDVDVAQDGSLQSQVNALGNLGDKWVPMMSGEVTIAIGSNISIDLPSKYTHLCVEGFTQGWRFSTITQRGTVWVTIQNASGGMEYIFTEYDSTTQKLKITNPATNTTSATVTQVFGIANIP